MVRILKARYVFYILLMEEILHQLIGSLSHYLQDFIYIPGGAGFLPSTVCKVPTYNQQNHPISGDKNSVCYPTKSYLNLHAGCPRWVSKAAFNGFCWHIWGGFFQVEENKPSKKPVLGSRLSRSSLREKHQLQVENPVYANMYVYCRSILL